MAWRTIPGVVGKVYRPELSGRGTKSPCPDCFECQYCGKDRCRLCRTKKAALPIYRVSSNKKHSKISMCYIRDKN